MFGNTIGNYGPLTSTLMGISRNRKKKGKDAGGEQPNQKLLGPDVSQPAAQIQTQSRLEPKITAGLGVPPSAPAPTGVPVAPKLWGGDVPKSPTGPTEERLINNMTKDPFRTGLLRHEGARRVEGADTETGAHQIYSDTTGNYTTGYGHKMQKQDWEELGIDPDDPSAVAGAEISDEWARGRFAEDSTQAYQQGGEYLTELGLPSTGPLADIIGNMTYQMGGQGVRGFSKMGSALKQGDTATAAKEMLNSKWARQTPMRAQELAQQMNQLGQLKTGLGS